MEHLKCSPPTSREGIEKYLAGGLIKGIGPVYAKKLVEKFGEEIFTVIDHYSVKLNRSVLTSGPDSEERLPLVRGNYSGKEFGHILVGNEQDDTVFPVRPAKCSEMCCRIK